MFLHETGEDNDSFSRQDLSSMNAVSTQRPAAPPSTTSSATVRANQQIPQPQPPPPQTTSFATSASPPTVHQISKDEAMSRSDSGDGSALPSSASWVTKNAQIGDSRTPSKTASVSTPSPMMSDANLVHQTVETQSIAANPTTAPEPTGVSSDGSLRPQNRLFYGPPHPLDAALKRVLTSSFKFVFDRSRYSEEELREIDNYPPIFDMNGGAVRHNIEKEREQQRLKDAEEELKILGAISASEEDDNPASGSLQLGGEPESHDGPNERPGQVSGEQRSALQRGFTMSPSSIDLAGSAFSMNNPSSSSVNGRGLTDQQQRQLMLLKSNDSQQHFVNGQFQQGNTNNTSQHHHQQSNPFQTQNQYLSNLQGHVRQASRYTFANDSVSASAVVKPAANAQLMAQQSSMMPPNQGKPFQNQSIQQTNPHTSHFFSSGVQGPPPGLKSSGTPPISGGGMFGQGHGFASAMGGSIGIGGSNGGSKNTNDDLMRELLRSRSGAGNGQGPESGKREFMFPSFLKQPMTSDPALAPSLPSLLYGSQLGTYQGYQDQAFQKQKKKGKKHRHANTSSSGGGGTVDLADPSILQARMHHGGVGQGQFGYQGQGGYNPNSMMYGGGYGGRW